MCYHAKLCKETQRISKPVGEDVVRDETIEGPFVGVKITSALQRQLDQCSSIHKRYFDQSEPQSLQIVTIDREEVIGRAVEQGARVDSLRDVARNIRSILLIICPQCAIGESKIKVYVRRGSRGAWA